MAVAGFVVVSGPPGSGKSTLAPELATGLGLPLFTKDTIKEALMDTLAAPDQEASKTLGAAATRVLLALAVENGRGVLESNWRASIALEQLSALPAPVVEVHCSVAMEISKARYARRAGTRHPGHFDDTRVVDDSMWTGEASLPVGGPWPVLSVNTATATDFDELVATLRELLPDSRDG